MRKWRLATACRFRAHTIEEIRLVDAAGQRSNQVAIIALLAPREASVPEDPDALPVGTVCVATTHLKAGTAFEAVRPRSCSCVVSMATCQSC